MTPTQMDFTIYMVLCLVDCFHTVNLAFYACVRAALPQTPLNPHPYAIADGQVRGLAPPSDVVLDVVQATRSFAQRMLAHTSQAKLKHEDRTRLVV